jgi:2-oxoglutarate ferredoxin oxidoreductase subunit beta
MTYIRSTFRHPALPKNDLGYTVDYYEGSLSTLCAGCGHDSINAAIVEACWEMSIEPHKVAKLSGIGCSSKSPAYFLANSHGFNSVHGRMPSVATGANLANRDLTYFGVSGDGDTASIGMGQFVHVVRRNLNMVYLVMNNGCYGLTKGQDSATADVGSKSKAGSVNLFEAIDLASLAIELGASFVAQSFFGRQGTAHAAAESRDESPWIRDAECHLALRHVQQQFGLDEIVRLRPRTRRESPARWTSSR